MSFTVQLQTNLSEKNKVNKTISNIREHNIVFKEDSNITKPVFTISVGIETLKNVNYCTIPKLGRSYFVEEIKTVRNGVCELSCVCDVLSSFKSQLLTNDCIVEKSENKYNLYLDDGSFRVYQNPYILTKKFPSGFNNTNSQLNMVLTVATGETV